MCQKLIEQRYISDNHLSSIPKGMQQVLVNCRLLGGWSWERGVWIRNQTVWVQAVLRTLG